MTYELAKKLKEAKFPTEELEGKWYADNPDESKEDFGAMYVPSLSELIEACGDSFYCVIRGRGSVEGEWFASNMTSPEFKIDKCFKGISPEEAVANLWLALQEDKK